MSLPVNKKTLDTTIDTNLPTQVPGEQLITAQKLRETLTPIVNSTFGMKTIWAGIIRSAENSSSSNNNWIFKVVEDYYDPNYFPSLNPTNLTSGLAAYQQAGCRYKLLTVGSGLTANYTYNNCATTVTTPGTVQSANLTVSSVVWRPASGLTFDVLTGPLGTVVGIKVNNPGSGYSWCGNNEGVAPINQVVTLVIPSSTPVTVEIDLSRVVSSSNSSPTADYPAVTLPYNGNSKKVMVHNFHIRDADLLNVNAPNILINIQDSPIVATTPTTSALYFQHDSTLGNQYKLYYSNGSTTDRTLPGYYALIPYQSTAPFYVEFNYYVELQVPINNTTI